MPFGSIDPHDMRRYGALSQVGFEMAAPIALGWALDYYLGWAPWGVVSGAILGFVGGLAHLVQLAKRLDEDDRQPPKQERQ